MARPLPAGSPKGPWDRGDLPPNLPVRGYGVPAQEQAAPEAIVRQYGDNIIAPPPQIDRFPIVIGTNLNLQYLSSVFRLCTQGWRYQWVDAINELLEHDPESRGVIRQRLLMAVGARIDVKPCDLPPNDPETDIAKAIAEEVGRQFRGIPKFTQAIGQLAWGIIYGLSGDEIHWRRKGRQWEVERLAFLHSRRLSFPNPQMWDLYVWDQGSSPFGPEPLTTGIYGLRVADFPGKFVIHDPALTGDYVTRGGEARFIAFYLAIKRMVVRAMAMDFERVIRPWVIGYFSRETKKDEKPIASQKDIAMLDQATKALGLGSLNSATLSDATRVELLRAASTLNAQEFIEWIDSQVALSLLSQTFTAQTGKYGSRSTAEVGERIVKTVSRYDAKCLGDTLEQYLVLPMVSLNFPGKEHLLPVVYLATDEEPDAKTVMSIAVQGASIDMPIDVDQLAELTGMPLVDADETDKRRTRLLQPGQAPAPPEDGEVVPEQETEPEEDTEAVPPKQAEKQVQ